jgi:hypothetical protein
VVVIVLAVVIVLVVASANNSGGSNTTSVATNPTFQEDVAAKPMPDSSPNDNTLLDNYKFQICNPVEGDNLEFCTVGNCFAGPHCSCEIYFREEESNNVIGFCNSCRICDFDGNMAFDCGNLGSSVQECPSAASYEDNEEVIVYTPPDSYVNRYCVPAFDPSTELCFAGECMDDQNCACDMYKREVASGDILGVCSSCGVCAAGGLSSDCTNVGLATVACRNDENSVSSAPTEQSAANVTGSELGNGESSNSHTNNSSSVQESSSSESTDQSMENANDVTVPELSDGKPEIGVADSSSPSQESNGIESGTESNASSSAVSCADPSNGVQLCHALSCKVSTSTCAS